MKMKTSKPNLIMKIMIILQIRLKKVKTIDDYCKTNNIKKINYLKIDTKDLKIKF